MAAPDELACPGASGTLRVVTGRSRVSAGVRREVDTVQDEGRWPGVQQVAIAVLLLGFCFTNSINIISIIFFPLGVLALWDGIRTLWRGAPPPESGPEPALPASAQAVGSKTSGDTAPRREKRHKAKRKKGARAPR